MRTLAVLLPLALSLAAPGVASAQTDLPPPIVNSLQTAEPDSVAVPWFGAVTGATIAIVGLNAWTGGALLTPAVGVGLSSILGGSWLGLSALTPIGAQSLFETTTLVSSGLIGGGIGYWLASD